MKSLTCLLLLFFLSAVPAHAEYRFAQNWTKTDTALEVTFVTLAVVDWGQTRWMAERNYKWDGQQYYEGNPFLGSQPSIRKVDFVIPVGIMFHGLIAMALPDKFHIKVSDDYEYDIYPRRVWQYLWIGAEGITDITSASLGVKMSF